MTIVGVTGHSNLSEATVDLVYREIRDQLARLDGADLVGVTCLARGADQVFADAVLALGGTIEVVVPAADYFDRITDPAARARCDRYLAQATATHTLPSATAGHDAYLAASKELVERCELLLAVWDGSRASGTGDAVEYAKDHGRETVVVWPEGAERV
ncbi:MAG: hypothetical protein GEU68_16990 [Actinobacteria bacterium]|nr:hypothetical protein [Actinomycetota bacterium]